MESWAPAIVMMGSFVGLGARFVRVATILVNKALWGQSQKPLRNECFKLGTRSQYWTLLPFQE
jgi:hypothetical protein